MGIANIILTSFLVVAAIAAVILAWHNLRVLRKQLKLNTSLSLLRELAEQPARQNRRSFNICLTLSKLRILKREY